MHRLSFLPLTAVSIVSVSLTAHQDSGSGDLAATLTRVGHQVEKYFARTRSLVCEETVQLQPLAFNLAPDGQMRQLVYELRVAWEPASDGDDVSTEASVLRQLLAINGRPPRPKKGEDCLDPRPVSPEPLAMLLPGRRHEYTFTWAGTGHTDGRASVKLDYRAVGAKPADITWRDECVSVDLPGRTRGRIWVDALTDDVLRLDEQLTGMFEFPVPNARRSPGAPSSMMIERADSSIRYRPVTFHDPDETLMLPHSIQSLTIIRNAGVPRLRTTQQYSNYRRFLTDARIKP